MTTTIYTIVGRALGFVSLGSSPVLPNSFIRTITYLVLNEFALSLAPTPALLRRSRNFSVSLREISDPATTHL